jgi:hypothetical protein
VKDRRRRPGSQSFPDLEQLAKSPLWQDIRRTQTWLKDAQERGLIPKLSPEFIERLRQMGEGFEKSSVGKWAREQRQRELAELQAQVEPAPRKRKHNPPHTQSLGGRRRDDIPGLSKALEWLKRERATSKPKKDAEAPLVMEQIRKQGHDLKDSQLRTIQRRIAAMDKNDTKAARQKSPQQKPVRQRRKSR